MEIYIIDMTALCNDIICNLFDNGLIVNGEENFEEVRDILMFYLAQIAALQIG